MSALAAVPARNITAALVAHELGHAAHYHLQCNASTVTIADLGADGMAALPTPAVDAFTPAQSANCLAGAATGWAYQMIGNGHDPEELRYGAISEVLADDAVSEADREQLRACMPVDARHLIRLGIAMAVQLHRRAELFRSVVDTLNRDGQIEVTPELLIALMGRRREQQA